MFLLACSVMVCLWSFILLPHLRTLGRIHKLGNWLCVCNTLLISRFSCSGNIWFVFELLWRVYKFLSVYLISSCICSDVVYGSIEARLIVILCDSQRGMGNSMILHDNFIYESCMTCPGFFIPPNWLLPICPNSSAFLWTVCGHKCFSKRIQSDS